VEGDEGERTRMWRAGRMRTGREQSVRLEKSGECAAWIRTGRKKSAEGKAAAARFFQRAERCG
jgi:hypothetical protein